MVNNIITVCTYMHITCYYSNFFLFLESLGVGGITLSLRACGCWLFVTDDYPTI